MTPLAILCLSALTIAIVHTATGPDHYLPFIALSKARNWSIKKTALITLLCGLGHVGSSVLIGLFGIGGGLALKSLELTEALRGDMAAWLLTGCGLIYMVWGIVHGIRHREHHHIDLKGGKITPWALFLIFVFGPCEPLIPLLMFPAATFGVAELLLVAGLFAVATLATMTALVLAASYGLKCTHGSTHRFAHAMAGGVVLCCGVAVQLGL